MQDFDLSGKLGNAIARSHIEQRFGQQWQCHQQTDTERLSWLTRSHGRQKLQKWHGAQSQSDQGTHHWHQNARGQEAL